MRKLIQSRSFLILGTLIFLYFIGCTKPPAYNIELKSYSNKIRKLAIESLEKELYNNTDIHQSDKNTIVAKYINILNNKNENIYNRFEAARVLAFMGDNHGQELLKATANVKPNSWIESTPQTSSGYEVPRAAVALIALNIKLPEKCPFCFQVFYPKLTKILYPNMYRESKKYYP